MDERNETPAVDRCPDCGNPTHATEGTADGRCIPCAIKKHGSVELPCDLCEEAMVRFTAPPDLDNAIICAGCTEDADYMAEAVQ